MGMVMFICYKCKGRFFNLKEIWEFRKFKNINRPICKECAKKKGK